MKKRKYSLAENAKLGDWKSACSRYGFGESKMRSVARDAGAIIRIGRSTRINFAILDSYMDALSGE